MRYSLCLRIEHKRLNMIRQARKEIKKKILPITASKEEIKKLVIEWNELLAQEKYKEALEMFLIYLHVM